MQPNKNYISVNTLDGVKVEVTFADAGRAPDAPAGGEYLNTITAWYKPDGGQWQRSVERSCTKTCEIIKHCNLNELGAKLGNQPKTISG